MSSAHSVYRAAFTPVDAGCRNTFSRCADSALRGRSHAANHYKKVVKVIQCAAQKMRSRSLALYALRRPPRR